jgi:S1-C subfamily serine protease
MKKTLASLLVILLFVPVTCAKSVPKKMEASTVLIRMKIHRLEDNKTGWGACSGVYIKKNIILSAAHCVDFPADDGIELKEIWIKNNDQKSERAVVVRVDPAADLLLLYTPLAGTPVKLAHKAIRGEDCWVIGNPLGLRDIVTKGIVSQINCASKGEKATFLIVDAIALPGNSGGAVVDSHGRLIGILTRSTSLFGSLGASGLGIAVDLKTIREFLKGIK